MIVLDPKWVHMARHGLKLCQDGATGSNIIFFDEQMIGIHSKLLKKNTRSISRTLKREKVKFKAKDVVDIMATSVFFYIEEAFIKK